jgi:NADPH:quinone reductase-like Zn-dependent oxidoreductase
LWTSHDWYLRKIEQMVSIVVREPRALEVESANVPEPKAGEVVVKVRRAGIYT